MVGETTHESAVGEGTERGALVLAALVGHERFGEYAPVVFSVDNGLDLEGSGPSLGYGAVYQDNIVDIARALIVQ